MRASSPSIIVIYLPLAFLIPSVLDLILPSFNSCVINKILSSFFWYSFIISKELLFYIYAI